VVELLVDDTLAHKSGRQVTGAGVFRDAIRSTVKLIVYTWGLNLVVVCLRVAPPGEATPIALPINLRVRTKTGGNKTTELAAAMTSLGREEIADWLPERSFHLTADGAYACLVGAQLPRTHVTSRMRRDAALYEPAPLRTGKRGRPALKGSRLGTPPELAAAAPNTAWTEGHRRHARPQRRAPRRRLRRALVRVMVWRSCGGRPRGARGSHARGTKQPLTLRFR